MSKRLLSAMMTTLSIAANRELTPLKQRNASRPSATMIPIKLMVRFTYIFLSLLVLGWMGCKGLAFRAHSSP